MASNNKNTSSAKRTTSTSSARATATAAVTDMFEKGSLPFYVRQYLAGRKQPATIRDIATFVMKRREYSNYGSARRSISRVVGQLVENKFVRAEDGPDSMLYSMTDRGSKR